MQCEHQHNLIKSNSKRNDSSGKIFSCNFNLFNYSMFSFFSRMRMCALCVCVFGCNNINWTFISSAVVSMATEPDSGRRDRFRKRTCFKTIRLINRFKWFWTNVVCWRIFSFFTRQHLVHRTQMPIAIVDWSSTKQFFFSPSSWWTDPKWPAASFNIIISQLVAHKQANKFVIRGKQKQTVNATKQKCTSVK